MKNANECKCKRCGWKWTPRKAAPVECPACKSRRWRTAAAKAPPKMPRAASQTVLESTETVEGGR